MNRFTVYDSKLLEQDLLLAFFFPQSRIGLLNHLIVTSSLRRHSRTMVVSMNTSSASNLHLLHLAYATRKTLHTYECHRLSASKVSSKSPSYPTSFTFFSKVYWAGACGKKSNPCSFHAGVVIIYP